VIRIIAMPRNLRLTSCLALALSSQGARKHRSELQSIAGVPVHNYRSDAQDWVLQFKHGASDDTLRRACKGKCALIGHPSKGGNAFVELHGDLSTVSDMVRENSELLEFLEPDVAQWIIPEVTHSDDDEEDDRSSGRLWNLERVGVSQRPNQGQGAHIYVLDTGVRVSHQEFGGRAEPTLDLTTGQGTFECEGNANCAADRQGHGTHCSGSAAGSNYGVASKATIHAVKVLSDNGSGQGGWSIAAIDWVVSKGDSPAVISMSLGSASVWQAYRGAIDTATSAGVVVVVAAGNSNTDSCGFSPAFVPAAITVGATRRKFVGSPNARAGYSNFGECNDIFAPGSSIKSASSSSDTGSATLSGTSMACPHVSGGAALLLAADSTLSSTTVMSSFSRSGRKGVISGLKNGDPDLFLWVGR